MGVPGDTFSESLKTYGENCQGYCFGMTNDYSCNQVPDDSYSGGADSWDSDDSSIASVNIYGTVTLQTVGAARPT